jgi:aspartyl protease family protein
VAAALLCGLSGLACAQAVSMSGRLGDKALLMIDGRPRTLAVGTTVQGVRLLSVGADEAVVEIDGRRLPLRLGGAQVNLGGNEVQGGSTIVLTAGTGGHFVALGAINGRAVEMIVDTGASVVALSQGEADRLGIKYREGVRLMASTANGQVPAHRVMLASVRVGDVQVREVEALVVPSQMPYVLLGNSFLTRFQMKRENDVMTLVKRP